MPYTIVLVRLDEQDDILIPAPLVSEGAGEGVHQGLRVRAMVEKVADVVGQLTWTADAKQ